MFLLLDAACGRVQVLLFTFESVRKRAGKSKRRWWWHAWRCWARVRVPVASQLPSGSPLRALPLRGPEERRVGLEHPEPLPGVLPSTVSSVTPLEDLGLGAQGLSPSPGSYAEDELAPSEPIL